MSSTIREQVQSMVLDVPEAHLPAIAKLLATGQLKAMDDEIADTQLISDWQKYLDEHQAG